MADPAFLYIEDDQAANPLKGINVDAAGGAGKVLRMVAEKVLHPVSPTLSCHADACRDFVVEASSAAASRKEGNPARRGAAKGRGSSRAKEDQ
jgi:peptidyl-prolyl cis-trans isomerase-like protein 2